MNNVFPSKVDPGPKSGKSVRQGLERMASKLTLQRELGSCLTPLVVTSLGLMACCPECKFDRTTALSLVS